MYTLMRGINERQNGYDVRYPETHIYAPLKQRWVMNTKILKSIKLIALQARRILYPAADSISAGLLSCITLCIFSLTMFQTAYGAIPQTINYQGFLIDKNTNLPVDTAQDVIFAFYTAETGGSPAYTESRCNVPVSKGRYEIEIGMSGGIPASIFQNNPSVWMEIQIDPDNSCSGSYEALSPRIKMQS